MFLDIQVDLIILKTYDQQFTLTTKKSLHIIFKMLWSGGQDESDWLFMAALCNKVDHYIFALWFLSSIFYLFFFPRLISAAADWISTIL